MDGTQSLLSDLSEWDRMTTPIPANNIAMTNNAPPEPTGSPTAPSSPLTISADAVAQIFVGPWRGVDMICHQCSDA